MESANFTQSDLDYFERFPWKPPVPPRLANILADQSEEVLSEANRILDGKIRFFSGKPGTINLTPGGIEKHWTETKDNDRNQDIKFIWESARFCWAYSLCRAYLITNNDQYAEAFWKYTQEFIENNPANMGPNWASGQEIALRLIAWVISGVVFKTSPASTQERKKMLITALNHHAIRIPKTLIYARAQNNNHLITEAVGMYTAGIFLKNDEWKGSGWKWLETALRQQIDLNGTYSQQSTNYHRLMLQAVLWANTLAAAEKMNFSPETLNRLANASKWIITHMDPLSGRAVNLGHNDGSLIMPLSTCQYADYRPTAQAASIAFLKRPYLPRGPWDEYCVWLGMNTDESANTTADQKSFYQPNILRIGTDQTWAVLRAETYTDRPAHADQLHAEIWWDGENIALDPGTYRYTAPDPWMNGLAYTKVHNTIEINDLDQMQSVSRFLWLNWAQGKKLKSSTDNCVTAEHNGYQNLGATHQRTICHTPPLDWIITDKIYSNSGSSALYKICIHWLLPNWNWNVLEDRLILDHNHKYIEIRITAKDQTNQFKNSEYIQLIRSGETIYGPEEYLPTMGWYSPTYDVKLPALSLRGVYQSTLPLEINTHWKLQEVPSTSS